MSDAEQDRVAATDAFRRIVAMMRRGEQAGGLIGIRRLDGETDRAFGLRLIEAGEQLVAGDPGPELDPAEPEVGR